MATTLATLLLAAPLHAEDPVLDPALEPMKQGVPEATISKLRERLASAAAEAAADPAAVAKTREHLIEALLVAGRPREALDEINEAKTASPASTPSTSLALLEARAHALLGNWAAALPLFEAHADQPGAALGRAEALNALGQREAAITALEAATREQAQIPTARIIEQLRLAELYLEANRLPDAAAALNALTPETVAQKKWKQYLDARLFLAQGQPNYALGRFEDLQRDPAHATSALVTGALLGVSDSRAELGGLAAADTVLEQFIWQHPGAPHLGDIFAKLDEIYTSEEASSDSELRKWADADSEHPLRAGYATYYAARLAERNGKRDRALRFAGDVEEDFPQHPIVASALLLKGQLLAGDREFAQAQATLEAAMRAARNDRERAEIEIASASVSFQQGEYVLAATVFRAAGERSPEVWERAVFNAALSWLYQGNHPRFLETLEELTRRAPDSPYRHELILEEGLQQARQGPEQAQAAEATLRKFIADFPRSSRVPEARLALAELRFAQGDTAGARELLNAFQSEERGPQPTPAVKAQADYLAIFVADAENAHDTSHDNEVIRLAEAYLEHHPVAPIATRRAEVHMKLGEVLSRVGDFAGAQSQFEALVKDDPGSRHAESALFLAAQASLKRMSEGAIDRALELFEEVTRLNGPLKLQARLQQALVQQRLGKPQDAILIYDAILRSDPEPNVRFAALAGKAANLAELGDPGKSDPRDPEARKHTGKEAREQALAIYTELAEAANLAPLWRSQALCEKGRLLEAMNRPDDALAAYYDVITAGLTHPQEYYWFYRAGFEAARLCERGEQWSSAIAVYQKMAALPGPRASEAEARVSQLRLEHFIWD